MKKTVTLEEVCEKITDGSHFSPKTLEKGIPYITVKDISEKGIDFDNCKFISDKSFDELKKNGCSPRLGDLLFSKDGTVGKVAEVKSEIEFSVLSSLAILTPNKTIILPSFLAYVLKSPFFLKQAIRSKTGAAIKRIILKNLKKIQFSLPTIEEQQKILSKLDATFIQINNSLEISTKKEIELEKLKKAILLSSFNNSCVNIPTKRIGEIFNTGSGGTPLKSKKEYYEGGKIPWLQSGAICEKYIKKSNTFITEDGLSNSSAKLFPLNSLLVAMYGATAGQVGILHTESSTNQAVCAIYPNKDFKPEYLYYYFLYYKKTLLQDVSGVAQPNLSQVKIRNIPIPLLSIEMQSLLIQKLEIAFKELNIAKNAISKIKKNLHLMKKVILIKEMQ